MENKEFLSIAEYAKIKGVSVQAVYKQLNNSLKPYLIIVEGKKKLKSTVLNSEVEKIVKPLNQPLKQPSIEDLNHSLIETLNKTVALLQEQLQTKDEQIKALNERLEQALNNTSQSNYIAATAINEGLPTAAAEEQSNAAEDTPQKKSIFQRIFKR